MFYTKLIRPSGGPNQIPS